MKYGHDPLAAHVSVVVFLVKKTSHKLSARAFNEFTCHKQKISIDTTSFCYVNYDNVL